MRLNRFYTERKNIREGSSIKLPDSDIKHIKRVLRLKKGDEIVIFNGEKEFSAELNVVSSEVIMAILKKQISEVDFSNEGKVEITLFQGLLRAGKLDFILEKVAELGIDYIAPIECEFSQMKKDPALNKIERWNRILISASKQSERVRVPELITPMLFTEAIEHIDEFDQIFFFSTDKKQEVIKFDINVDKKNKKIAYFIGPEGGFSPNEHKLAASKNLKFYSLGNTVLRSETASIFAGGLLNFLYN